MKVGERPAAALRWEWAACAGLALILAVGALWGTEGAALRVLLMYLASGALAACGWFVGRKVEPTGTYGRMLIAGGLAGVYFTTYAAHSFRSIPLVSYPWLAGLLLLACAGLMGWVADRQRSAWMLMLALTLAWLAGTVKPFLLFTFCSDLVLAGVAVWLLFRRERATACWITLVLIHAGFLIWWPYSGGAIDPDRYLPLREFRIALAFFAAYWALFTLAAVRSRESAFAGERRVLFATINNALFFAQGVLILPPRYPEWFWKFAAAFGAVLLGVSFFAREYPRLQRAYIIHGALLIALGLISAATGRHPATLLALGSVLLVLTVEANDQWVPRLGAVAAALLASAFAWGPAYERDANTHWIGVLTGSLLVFGAWWISRARSLWFKGAVATFAVLGLGVWLITTFGHAHQPHLPAFLAIEALLLTASFALLAVREIPYLGKAFVLAAIVMWFAQQGYFARPWWSPVVVVAATLWISYWWQHRGRSLMPAWELHWVQVVAAGAVVAIVLFSVESLVAMTSAALVLMGLLALGFVMAAMLFGNRYIVAFAQLFTATMIGEFIGQLSHPPLPGAFAAFIPIPILLTLAVLIPKSFSATPWAKTARIVAMLYRFIAGAIFIVWVLNFVAPANRFLTLSLTGMLLLLLCVFTSSRVTLLESLLCATGALVAFWWCHAGQHGFLFRDLLAFVLLLGYGVLGRRHALLPPGLQEMGVIVGLLSVAWWVTLWAQNEFPVIPMTVVLSIVAVIVLIFGWWLSEWLYRFVSWALLFAAAVWLIVREAGLPSTFQVGLLALGLAFLSFAFSYSRRQSPAIEPQDSSS